MTGARKLIFGAVGITAATCGFAQVPDLVTAFDAGGRAMGAGGSFYVSGSETISAALNPAALGYIEGRRVGLAFRNLPNTDTTVTGPLDDLRLSTEEDSGGMALTHFGYAMPFRRSGGTLGLAWTVAGWMNDRQTGTGLPGGIATYNDHLKLKTDLITLGYGKAVGDRTLSWGAGVVYAVQYLKNFQRITFTDSNIPPQIAETEDTGSGVGAVIGLMFTPPRRPDVTVGISVRSPIEVNGGSAFDLYERIPGRASAGLSFYRHGLRGGRDSLIYAVQGDFFFGGKKSDRVDRKNQGAFGVGVEYAYALGDDVVPLRIGYRLIGAGGDDFEDRNGVTYGIGYRSRNGTWSIDLNFAIADSGERDTSLSLTYRFPK